MASIEELRENRLKKLEILKSKGIESFPISSGPNLSALEAKEKFSSLLKSKKKITLAGRIMSIRGQGAIMFSDLYDGTDKFQLVIKRDELGEELSSLFVDTVDIADFIEATGKVFKTKRGEMSLSVTSWRMLAKSLRQLPEKWHGLTDTEERFRRRYLDILMNEDVRNRFLMRSKIVSEIRKFLDKKGFMEVETQMLQPEAGGASAKPFLTHHNALDIDLFLRIAPELYLKRLLVAGFPKVYEIGRCFRNEGIDATHNPEFTMLEWYEAYSDAEKQMKFIELLMRQLDKISGRGLFGKKSFPRVTYSELFRKHALISDITSLSEDELSLKAAQLGVSVDGVKGIPTLLDVIYKKLIRPKIEEPTFVVEYPSFMLPLAKRIPGKEGFVDAFQLVVKGVEVVKAFSELNDPIDQRKRLEEQEKFKEGGDEEAQSIDEDFLEALEHGMPPAGGVGIGIDRLVMLLTDTHNIREVVIFPTLRPKI